MKDLRKLQQAGGKLQNVLIQELISSVPQAKVFVMYGQTEATARQYIHLGYQRLLRSSPLVPVPAVC